MSIAPPEDAPSEDAPPDDSAPPGLRHPPTEDEWAWLEEPEPGLGLPGDLALDPELVQDLEGAIARLDSLQGEVACRQARETLRGLLAGLDLSARERSGLEAELAELAASLARLEQAVVQIAVFGAVGRGKSSLLNALLGKPAFPTGAVHGVTRQRAAARWAIDDPAIDPARDLAGDPAQYPAINPAIIDETGNRPSAELGLALQVELVDTPGLDEVDGEERARLARQVGQQADLVLFVVSGDLSANEWAALAELREAGKPLLLVFNKVDRYPATDRQLLYETIRDRRVRQLVSPEEIVLAAAAPLIPEPVQRPDGSRGVVWRPGPPQIAALQAKIRAVLAREGRSLVALNALMRASHAYDRLVARKLVCRERAAERLIWQGALAKAAAVALNPVTVLDLLGGAAIDATTIAALSRLYDLPLSQRGAIELLKTIALSLGGLGASEALVRLGLGGLKTLLGGATVVTGGAAAGPYVAVAIAQAGVAGVSSVVIGRAAQTYLANDASWGEDGPATVAQRILAGLDERAILKRIEGELRAKLG